MVSTEEKPNDAKVEALQFHFTAEIDNDKLIIHAINSNPNEDLQYWVEKYPNQFMDFQEIKTIINQGHTKIVSIAQKNLKIKVGGTPFELTPKPKSQINDLKDRIKKIISNHSSLEKTVKQQNDELKDQKSLVSELKNQVRLLNEKLISQMSSLKDSLQLEIKSKSSFQEQMNCSSQKVNNSENIASELKLKDVQFSKKIDFIEKDIFEQKNLFHQVKKQVQTVKQCLNNMSPINSEVKQDIKLTDNKIFEGKLVILQNNVQQINDSIKNIKQHLEKKFISMINRFNRDQLLINDLIDKFKSQKTKITQTATTVSQHTDQLQQHETKITQTATTVSQHNDQLKQHETKITQTATTVSQHTDQLKKVNNQLSIQIKKIQQIGYQLYWPQFPKDFYPPINEPIKSCKWSEQLKSKALTINKNVVTCTTQSPSYFEFCLLNASFSNTLNTKQSWTIKINKINKLTGGTRLGVCLKSKMQKYNFNSQNIKWGETGHGLYLIDSCGWCYSHSQKEFNRVNNKSFEFGDGDVIFIEYDPLNNKLRFNKNKVDNFEMRIIAPPQNDAYHPCVGLFYQNDQVELMHPSSN